MNRAQWQFERAVREVLPRSIPNYFIPASDDWPALRFGARVDINGQMMLLDMDKSKTKRAFCQAMKIPLLVLGTQTIEEHRSAIQMWLISQGVKL